MDVNEYRLLRKVQNCHILLNVCGAGATGESKDEVKGVGATREGKTAVATSKAWQLQDYSLGKRQAKPTSFSNNCCTTHALSCFHLRRGEQHLQNLVQTIPMF